MTLLAAWLFGHADGLIDLARPPVGFSTYRLLERRDATMMAILLTMLFFASALVVLPS